MIAQGNTQWVVIALVAAMYVVMCVRVARRMAHIGRSGAAWFFISLFCTSIPAAVLLKRHYHRGGADERNSSRPTRRCRHCGAVLGDEAAPNGRARCPQCDMTLNEETLA